MPYTAPIKDQQFVLQAIAGLEEVLALPGNEDTSVELVDAILEEANKFASAILAPLNKLGDKGHQLADGVVTTVEGFKEAYHQFRDAGWVGMRAPVEFGGQGLPALVTMATEEMWCASNLAFSLCPLLTLGAVEALDHHASDELKAIYLPKMSSGEWPGTMNLTEPQAGSDLAQVRSKAIPQADGSYLISGQKIFITWGEHDMADNIVHLVLARLPDAPAGVKGISLFVVPKFLVNADGSLGKRNDAYCVSIEHKLGIHGSPTCVMSYGDNGGAVGYLVGEANKGLAYMFTMMNHARLGVGVEGMAISERAYQKAVAYAKDRIQSRELGSDNSAPAAIIRHPDVRRMLMTMRAYIEGMRALTYFGGAALDKAAKHPDAAERQKNQYLINFLIPIIKGWNTEVANVVTSLGVQVHGGMGFIEETGAAQHMRDARITAIYEGTTGIHGMDLIGRKLASEKGLTCFTLLQEIDATLVALGQENDPTLAAIQRGVKQAALAAKESADFLLARFDQQPKQAAAGSVPFLMLMGVTLAGWLLAKSALIAKQQLAAGGADEAFCQNKLITARFFAEHIASQALAYGYEITQGAESTLALPDDQF
ncbi:acyl-CoA dehydrogenase [Chitinivorax tropicus]|uniref:3-methylmercaptopropionyl-CoA dehydrogenase n=1 Tax=Chitinivorax tropicus TaxID=714531 RepID=A0A840MT33_9PROT|nr:acyl-CoA dehydrogenase C-terminal domain-containing protein [Chitinivorax tropicus]MBB5019433.1 acyl-CoA dehydrogenase [Chitinivorax tropicus]